ncbi:MAG: hypothetical protein KDC95_06465 [Planctomycetes bacterium]|nr:hypothetical protein [Planctomycetota bacterium]
MTTVILLVSSLAACVVATLMLAFSPTGRGFRLARVLATVGAGGTLWLLGFPLLAGTAAIATLALRRRGAPPAAVDDAGALRSQVLPVFAALALGISFPYLQDASIDSNALPPPIEGLSAAVGGAGFWLTSVGRGLLATCSVVVLAILALLAYRAARGSTTAARSPASRRGSQDREAS